MSITTKNRDMGNRYVGIFAAAQDGNKRFRDAAAQVGQMIASRGYSLVYGGGNTGLMRATVDAALHAGAKVMGVVPTCYSDPELLHQGLSHIEFVSTIAERKAFMQNIADSIVVLPGGLGTLDEVIDLLNANRFTQPQKPCVLLNTDHYYDDLISFIDHGTKSGLISRAEQQLLVWRDDPVELVDWVCLNSPP